MSPPQVEVASAAYDMFLVGVVLTQSFVSYMEHFGRREFQVYAWNFLYYCAVLRLISRLGRLDA